MVWLERVFGLPALHTKLMRRLKPIYFISFILAFGALVILSGCEIKSKELKAMLENPVANMQLITAQEVERSYKDKDVTFGKPIYARVKIEYEPIGNHTKEDVYNEIVKKIESSGWSRDAYNVGHSGYYSASLPHESFSLVVEVFNHPDIRNVRISIKHGARRK